MSLSKETDNIAKPLLFIKEGRFPSLSSTFSNEVSSVAVELDPGFNGVSIDQHTSAAAPGYADKYVAAASGVIIAPPAPREPSRLTDAHVRSPPPRVRATPNSRSPTWSDDIAEEFFSS